MRIEGRLFDDFVLTHRFTASEPFVCRCRCSWEVGNYFVGRVAHLFEELSVYVSIKRSGCVPFDLRFSSISLTHPKV